MPVAGDMRQPEVARPNRGGDADEHTRVIATVAHRERSRSTPAYDAQSHLRDDRARSLAYVTRIGRRVLVRSADLLDFLDHNRTPSPQECRR
jgi:hypothetical protein